MSLEKVISDAVVECVRNDYGIGCYSHIITQRVNEYFATLKPAEKERDALRAELSERKELSALNLKLAEAWKRETEAIRAELSETRAHYEQYVAAMGQNLEDRDSEIERLSAEVEKWKGAYMEWIEKTEWMQEGIQTGSLPAKYLGLHRADAIRATDAACEGCANRGEK